MVPRPLEHATPAATTINEQSAKRNDNSPLLLSRYELPGSYASVTESPLRALKSRRVGILRATRPSARADRRSGAGGGRRTRTAPSGDRARTLRRRWTAALHRKRRARTACLRGHARRTRRAGIALAGDDRARPARRSAYRGRRRARPLLCRRLCARVRSTLRAGPEPAIRVRPACGSSWIEGVAGGRTATRGRRGRHRTAAVARVGRARP